MRNIHTSFHPCPSFMTDRDLYILSSNRQWGEIFKNSDYLGDLADITALTSVLRDTSTIFPFQCEISLKGKDETLRPYLWIVVAQEKDTLNFYGYSLSVEKKWEMRYERMFHSTTDAIMLLSGEHFTDCNQATLNLFKIKSAEEFTQCHPADLSPLTQPDGELSKTKADRMIERAFKEGHAFFSWTHRDSEGKSFPCEVLLSKLELDGVFFLQASVRDISERVYMQREVDEMRISQVNAARLASLGEMAGGIAHEINNPMTIIRAQAEFLQRGTKELDERKQEQLQKGLNKIVATVDRITKIIKGLRAISRDSSHDPMIESNLQDILVDISTLFEEKFRINTIKYEQSISDPPVQIWCRPVEISQVILNLLNNSYDAIYGTPNPWISVAVNSDEKFAYLKFSDSGNGIPEKVREKIFEPFYTTKDVGKGTGLGLSISKGIIEGHGGQFYFDQTEPHTTFRIVLPLFS